MKRFFLQLFEIIGLINRPTKPRQKKRSLKLCRFCLLEKGEFALTFTMDPTHLHSMNGFVNSCSPSLARAFVLNWIRFCQAGAIWNFLRLSRLRSIRPSLIKFYFMSAFNLLDSSIPTVRFFFYAPQPCFWWYFSIYNWFISDIFIISLHLILWSIA